MCSQIVMFGCGFCLFEGVFPEREATKRNNEDKVRELGSTRVHVHSAI